jgi:hypothetical protein
LSAINVPEGKDVIAHRVIGFSSGDDYEYDWANVDWSKPQSEWPRAYFAPEKNFKNNYVVSDLAALDANVQLTDTTTEGATLAWSEVTTEWLGEHGYKLGNNVDTPWVLSENTLTLWFEGERVGTGIEDVWAEDANGTQSTTRKMIINSQVIIMRNGKMYNLMGCSL